MMSLLHFVTSKLWGSDQQLPVSSDNEKVLALPSEILHSIFDYLDKPDLKACCLTSRSISSVAREHLIAQVSLKNGHDCASFHELLHNHPEVATFIRALEIVTEGRDRFPDDDWGTLHAEKLAYILDTVSASLFEFTYQTGCQGQIYDELPSELRQALARLIRTSPRLTSISILHFTFPIQIFTAATQLTTIRLVDVDVDHFFVPAEDSSTKLDNITSLIIDSGSDDTLRTLLDMYSFPVLRNLELQNQGRPHDIKLVHSFLDRTRSSLQRFTWGPIIERGDLPIFGEATGIESLTLGPSVPGSGDTDAWRWFISGLGQGPSTHGLEELRLEGFRSHLDYSTMLVGDPLFKLLDEALSRPKYGRLKQVTLVIPVSIDEWMEYGSNPSTVVLTQMPYLVKEGRVRVVMGGEVFP